MRGAEGGAVEPFEAGRKLIVSDVNWWVDLLQKAKKTGHLCCGLAFVISKAGRPQSVRRRRWHVHRGLCNGDEGVYVAAVTARRLRLLITGVENETG